MARSTATSLGASGASTLSQKDHAGPENDLRVKRAVQAAEQYASCPSISHPLYAFSQSSGRAFAMSCKSWGCPGPSCGRRKRAAAQRAIEIGMTRAFLSGRRLRFMTLTDDAAGEMTVADLYSAWHRLRIKLRRRQLLDQYVAVVETQKRGALHLHVVTTGKYIPQAQLSDLGVWAGFGAVTDIREVRRHCAKNKKCLADYVCKELAAYISKDGASLAAKANVRRRPVRFSRDWGCSLRIAEQLIADERAEELGESRDPGPWLILRKTQDGTLVAMNQPTTPPAHIGTVGGPVSAIAI